VHRDEHEARLLGEQPIDEVRGDVERLDFVAERA
jgi:hypothetical protein